MPYPGTIAERDAKLKERRMTGTGRCKCTSDTWRTFNGAHYDPWLVYVTPERVKAYRNEGIRCRRVGHTLYVHTLDTDAASALEAREGWDR